MNDIVLIRPNDKKAWETEDAYMFGPDVLVAPVLFERQFEYGWEKETCLSALFSIRAVALSGMVTVAGAPSRITPTLRTCPNTMFE